MSNWIDTQADNTGDFEALPEGVYQCLVESITVDQTKAKMNGTAQRGEMVKVTLDVLNDKYAGRKLFERFNISHDNPKAQNIGRAQFARMAKACGVDLKVSEPAELNFSARKEYFETQLACLKDKVVRAQVVVRFDDYRQDNINEVKKYLGKDEATKTATTTTKTSLDEVPF